MQQDTQILPVAPLNVQDPVGDVAKKALAAVTAATIALSPLAANAGPLDSVLNQVRLLSVSCLPLLSLGE